MLQIKITKGTKRVNLRLIDSQTLHVSVPSYYGQKDCDMLLRRYREWIDSNSEYLRAKEAKEAQELHDRDGEILYFGEWLSMSKLAKEHNVRNINDMYAELEALLRHFCTSWAEQMQVSYTSIQLSKAQSFFGICTFDNRLRFSRMLVFAPKECIMYVVIHELAHIRYKNHSKAFWAFVERFCVEYKQYRALLRHNAWLYKALLRRHSTCLDFAI